MSQDVFALRGGSEPEISLVRYPPDGQSYFLGFAPLDFPRVKTSSLVIFSR
jgi:hypothetical protein